MMIKLLMIALGMCRVGAVWECGSSPDATTEITIASSPATTTEKPFCASPYPTTQSCNCMKRRIRSRDLEDPTLCVSHQMNLRLTSLIKPSLVKDSWILDNFHGPNKYELGLIHKPQSLNSSKLDNFEDLVKNNQTRYFVEEAQDRLCERGRTPVYRQMNLTWEIFKEDFRPRFETLKLNGTLNNTIVFQFEAQCEFLTLRLPQVVAVAVDQAYFAGFRENFEGWCSLKFGGDSFTSDSWDHLDQSVLQKKCKA